MNGLVYLLAVVFVRHTEGLKEYCDNHYIKISWVFKKAQNQIALFLTQ